jgi:hypothetical protein
VQVLVEQIPKLHLFFPHESTLSAFAAADGSILGDFSPESACYNSSQETSFKSNEVFNRKKCLLRMDAATSYSKLKPYTSFM